MKYITLIIFLLFMVFGCGKKPKKKVPLPKTTPPTQTVSGVLGEEIDTVKLKKELTPPVYNYDPAGRIDPFVSLVGKGYERGEEKVIDLSNLELVGIMGGPGGKVALFESPDGRSYSIRQGDAVRGGYVKDITDKKVIVEITEYGVPLTVTYEIKREASLKE
jgi:Tfp pilus assembly protein PilP